MPTTNEKTVAELAASTEAPRYLPTATLRVGLTAPDISRRDPVFGIVANMSSTGACLIINRALPVETKLALSVSIKGCEDLARVSAEVVWSVERLEPIKEIVGYLTGVTFETESKETVQELLSSGMFQLVS